MLSAVPELKHLQRSKAMIDRDHKLPLSRRAARKETGDLEPLLA